MYVIGCRDSAVIVVYALYVERSETTEGGRGERVLLHVKHVMWVLVNEQLVIPLPQFEIFCCNAVSVSRSDLGTKV